MITLSLTETAQPYVQEGSALHFTTFIASDSFDYADMEAYRRGEYSGDATFLEFPIAYLNITPKGYTYSIGHESYTQPETLVDIVGALEAYKATTKFEVNSIGLIAKFRLDLEDDNFYGNMIFAFGSLELNTYPLPVIAEDSMTFIIPFQVSYGDITEPALTAPDNLVPWKNFNEHNYKQIVNPTQTHNLYVDLQNMEFRVENTSFPIPTGESDEDRARLDRIEAELEDAVLYKPEESISSNATIAAVNADNNTIVDSTVKVSSMATSTSQTQLETFTSNIQSLLNTKTQIATYSWNFGTSSGWTTSDGLKYKDIITDWVSRGLPAYPTAVVLIPRDRNWYDYGVSYEIVYYQRYHQNPYLRAYVDPNATLGNNVAYTVLALYDPYYYNTRPIHTKEFSLNIATSDWSSRDYYWYIDDADINNSFSIRVALLSRELVEAYSMVVYSISWQQIGSTGNYRWVVDIYCQTTRPSVNITLPVKVLY